MHRMGWQPARSPPKAAIRPEAVHCDCDSHGQLLNLVLRQNTDFNVLKHQVELKPEITMSVECKEFALHVFTRKIF